MAQGKKTFIFYSDWINMVREMPNKDAGELLKHILSYVNDESPKTQNQFVRMAFGHMKPLIKNDLKKWDEIREKRKKAGSKGGRQTQANAKQLLQGANQSISNESKSEQAQAVNDNVNVSTNVDVDSLYDVDILKNYYLENDKVVSAIISNKDNKLSSKKQLEERLTEFNEYMKQQRRLSEKFKEYSRYFLNWNRKKKEIETRSEGKVSVSEWEQNPYKNS